MDLISKAEAYARQAHDGQFRKFSKLHEPYVTHVMRVAQRVSQIDWSTDEMVAAAWLHDVMEDTGVSQETLAGEFGEVVADLVAELTNPSKSRKDLSRAERKAMDFEHLKGVSREAKLIKLADRIDNVTDLFTDEVATDEFKATYRAESGTLLERLRGTHEELEEALENLLET